MRVLVQDSGPLASSLSASDFGQAHGGSSGMPNIAGSSSHTQDSDYPITHDDPFTYGNPLTQGIYPLTNAGNPETYSGPFAHNYSPLVPGYHPFNSGSPLTSYTTDPSPFMGNAGYWSLQADPPCDGREQWQAMGHRPCIARRIARKVYGIDPEWWSRRARSFVL